MNARSSRPSALALYAQLQDFRQEEPDDEFYSLAPMRQWWHLRSVFDKPMPPAFVTPAFIAFQRHLFTQRTTLHFPFSFVFFTFAFSAVLGIFGPEPATVFFLPGSPVYPGLGTIFFFCFSSLLSFYFFFRFPFSAFFHSHLHLHLSPLHMFQLPFISRQLCFINFPPFWSFYFHFFLFFIFDSPPCVRSRRYGDGSADARRRAPPRSARR